MKKLISTFIALTMIITVAACAQQPTTAISTSDTLAAAERYLSELNYEQAIIEFDKILEVEPKNVDAYLGKAEAYIALGNTEAALSALREGYEQTGDERLKTRLDEMSEHDEAEPEDTALTMNQ